MTNSPEQVNISLNGDSLNHDVSTSSVASNMSGCDSPPNGDTGAILHHHHLGLVATSTPNSPQVSSRNSSRKLGRGVKKFLRIPGGQTPTISENLPPTVGEDPIEPNKEALFLRMLRGSRIRTFRRSKRRGADKQYHSDDGYTSDPGIIREEDDDETDVDVDSLEVQRRQHQIRNLESKLEKARNASLQVDLEGNVSDQDLQNALLQQGMDDKQAARPSLKSSLKAKSQRKKIESLEAQLLLQEGRPTEHRYTALKKLGGGLKEMSLGLKGKLNFKRPKRFSNARDEVIDDDEDDDEFPVDEISQTGESVLHVETQEFTNESELLPVLQLTEKVDLLKQRTEDCLLDNLKARENLQQQKTQVERLQEVLNTIYIKLEQERERTERLESQVNDITELHQHEVGELRSQISQMENMTMSKSQDVEEAMEAYHSKLERLDAFVHQLIDSEDHPSIHPVRGPVANLLSFVLMIFAMLLNLISIIKTKTGFVIALILVLLAIIVYFLSYR